MPLPVRGPDQSGPAKRDWSELAFLLQLIPDLQDLNLEAQGLDAEGLRRLLPVLPLFSTLRWAKTCNTLNHAYSKHKKGSYLFFPNCICFLIHENENPVNLSPVFFPHKG